MWLREELKIRGKNCFLKNYLTTVAVGAILLLLNGDLFRFRFEFDIDTVRDMIWNGFHSIEMMGITGLFSMLVSGLVSMIGLLGILFTIFVKNILEVGVKRMFMENREHRTGVGTILYGFQSKGYGNVALTLFLRDLYTALWTLLFIIPGIVKSYEYRMVPYILSENPEMPHQRAFEISRKMMTGQKLDTFILDLSFIGWAILGGLTCGIVKIFYLKPYYEATYAELYAVFRAHAFYTGALTYTDLPGYGEANDEYIRS